MACDIPGSADCTDHAPAAINLFIPILLVCVLFALGTGVIFRRFGFLGGRPLGGGGFGANVDGSGFPFDDGQNFGEIPKIYDFSMKRDVLLVEEGEARWITLLPVSAYHTGDDPETGKAEDTEPTVASSPNPLSRLRRLFKYKSPDRSKSPEEQDASEQPTDVVPRPISTSVIIAMPTNNHTSPSVESEVLPDIVLGIADARLKSSPIPPPAKVFQDE